MLAVRARTQDWKDIYRNPIVNKDITVEQYMQHVHSVHDWLDYGMSSETIDYLRAQEEFDRHQENKHNLCSVKFYLRMRKDVIDEYVTRYGFPSVWNEFGTTLGLCRCAPRDME